MRLIKFRAWDKELKSMRYSPFDAFSVAEYEKMKDEQMPVAKTATEARVYETNKYNLRIKLQLLAQELYGDLITRKLKGQDMNEPTPSINTDKTIFKQPTTDCGPEYGNDSGIEPSVFVTKEGLVGFNHYGTCFVKSIKDWVEMARYYSGYTGETRQ